MRPFIEKILDVKGDGNCGFRAIAESIGLTEESHVMERRTLIRDVKDHSSDYMRIYRGEEHYNCILNGLHPPENGSGITPPDEWLTFPNMGYIVATYYNRVVVEITSLEIGISETFYPIRGKPPINPKSHIMCLGLIPNHFVLFFLKMIATYLHHLRSRSYTRAKRHRHGNLIFWINMIASENS